MQWKIAKRLDQNLITHLLKLRKITSPEAFLNPAHPSSLTASDVKLEAKSLSKASERIAQAIKKKEPIVIYGDYDADGITGTAILWEALKNLGAQVLPFIPDRKRDGYGLSQSGLDNMFKKYSPALIISVDNGISADKEVKKITDSGIDVIITDHHQLPCDEKMALLKKNTVSIVHTEVLSGAGIAWYLSKYLSEKIDEEHLALAALGTVADIVSLLGPNRQIVNQGLKSLTLTERTGLIALKEVAGISEVQIQPYHIGYILGPRINAVGRIENSLDALRLLCTKDKKAAQSLANKLNRINRERQTLLETYLQDALVKAEKENPAEKQILIIESETYEEGLIGLIAGKLTEKYYRPTIVLSKGSHSSKASARSVPGVNIISLIRETEDLSESCGGHPMAAGFTVKNSKIAALKDKLSAIAGKKIKEADLIRKLEIDAQLKPEEISEKLYHELARFAPFGVDNPHPVFCTNQIKVSDLRTVGGDGKHLKFKIHDQIDAIAFKKGSLLEKLDFQKPVDLAYSLELNTWNNQQKLQLKIKDIKQSYLK